MKNNDKITFADFHKNTVYKRPNKIQPSVFILFIYSFSASSLCPKGTFLKTGLLCVPDCGPGYYGNTQSKTCEKCSSDCKTCLSGEANNNCSSCNPPLYLKGISTSGTGLTLEISWFEPGRCTALCSWARHLTHGASLHPGV